MDFEQVQSWAGRVYVAFVLGVFSWRVVASRAQATNYGDIAMLLLGWHYGAAPSKDSHSSPSNYSRSTIPVLQRSIAPRQYTTVNHVDELALDSIVPLIKTGDDANGKALLETINGLHKTECVRTMHFDDCSHKTVTDVQKEIAGCGRLVPSPTAPR